VAVPAIQGHVTAPAIQGHVTAAYQACNKNPHQGMTLFPEHSAYLSRLVLTMCVGQDAQAQACV